MQLKFDPEFKALIPPLSEDERAELRASLQSEGCRDKLITWNDTIIDGHNRYEICQELGIEFKTAAREFEDRNAAMVWIIRNQFGRRNLTPYVRAQLALKLKPLIAEKAKENKETTQFGSPVSPKLVEPIDTQKELASAAAVSHGTLHKVETVERDAPEPIKRKAREGEISTHRAYKMTKALQGADQDVVDVVARWDVDEPDTVEDLKRLKASNGKPGSNGTWDGIVSSGYIQPGDEDDAVHISDSPSKIRTALSKLSGSHADVAAKHKPKLNRSGDIYEPQGYDSCQTPPEALDPLLPFLRPEWTIWEPARGEGYLEGALYDGGIASVIGGDIQTGENFFDYAPPNWDALVTNPPYSIKYKWLERCYELGKPFALLMPVEMLGAKTAQALFRVHGVEIVFIDGRVNFKMPNAGWEGSSAQFPTAWFTYKLDLPSQMVFSGSK